MGPLPAGGPPGTVMAVNVELPGLPAGLIDDRSAAAVAALAAEPGRVPLVIFEVPAGDVGPLVGEAFARACLTDPAARRADVRVCQPDGDRWSVAEVDTMLIGPSRLRPTERNMFVVAAADAMDARCAEHLLKTVEEPAAASLFVFLTPSAGVLLPTIVGRAGRVVQVRLADPARRAAGLVAAGADPAVASEAVALAGPLTALAARAVQPGEKGAQALQCLRALALVPLAGPGPAGRAAQMVAACEQLAPSGPAAKAVVRDLCRHALRRWRSELSMAVPAVLDASGFAWVANAAAALDAAEKDLGAYTSPLVTLTALFSRVGSLPG